MFAVLWWVCDMDICFRLVAPRRRFQWFWLKWRHKHSNFLSQLLKCETFVASLCLPWHGRTKRQLEDVIFLTFCRRDDRNSQQLQPLRTTMASLKRARLSRRLQGPSLGSPRLSGRGGCCNQSKPRQQRDKRTLEGESEHVLPRPPERPLLCVNFEICSHTLLNSPVWTELWLVNLSPTVYLPQPTSPHRHTHLLLTLASPLSPALPPPPLMFSHPRRFWRIQTNDLRWQQSVKAERRTADPTNHRSFYRKGSRQGRKKKKKSFSFTAHAPAPSSPLTASESVSAGSRKLQSSVLSRAVRHQAKK